MNPRHKRLEAIVAKTRVEKRVIRVTVGASRVRPSCASTVGATRSWVPWLISRSKTPSPQPK
jgi:hypothetical protein